MRYLILTVAALFIFSMPVMAGVGGAAQSHSSQENTAFDTNNNGATTTSISMHDALYVSLFVKAASGTHSTHVITIQMSPNGTDWYDTSSTLTGAGKITNVLCIAAYVRAKVTTSEPGTSTVDVIMVVK